MKPMRLKAVLRETWRNVATGTSRCALIWLLLSICGGRMHVRRPDADGRG